jgi:tripartite-type tricarboxylate transporter receptor subunit TctC
MLRRDFVALSTTALLGAPLTVRAQAADRGWRLVVGFPPGTGPDVVARTLAQKLGPQITVDNRTGAGGQIAAQAVAKGAADGSQVLLGEVGSIAIAPAAYSKLPYDPARELVPLGEVVRSDFVLVAPATSPTRDVATFVAAARAQKDRVNFATFGAGTPGHFGAVEFGEQAGVKVEPVHYRSTGDAMTALIAGDVKAAFVSTALAMAQVKGGKMIALATTASARSPLLPDVPTFAEAGFPKMDVAAWFALFVPTATPEAQQDALARQAQAALQAADVRQTLQQAGFTVVASGRADAARMVKAEAARWAGIVKASGFKAD